MGRRTLGILCAAVAAALAVPGVASAGDSFPTLAAGFTQDLFGVQPSFMGGVAFAPDGDPITNDCAFDGSPLHRFDRSTVLPAVHSTSTLHARTDMPSNAGCGLTQLGGFLYSNTSEGVVKLDPATGAQLAGPGGPPGNALGITVDPLTQNLVYVGGNGDLIAIDPTLTSSTTFSSALSGHFLDGVAFSPDGQFLFVADRGGGPTEALSVIKRDGTLAQAVPAPGDPDGIAFHANAPHFVVSNNGDGTITRFDFPGDDYTATPTLSTFASGGFRGDLTQVGPDGCLYVSQDDGTRYDDGTVDGNSSLVRICAGFEPPAGVEGPPSALNCFDGDDNDGDGLIDQADPDCQSPEGPAGSTSCSDGVDNDGDGLIDSDDPGCQGGGTGGGGGKCSGKTVTITGSGVINGTPGDDVIAGSNGVDTINGGGGNDVICGRDGNDKIRGGAGNDSIFGGLGDDDVGGQSGNDLVLGGFGNDHVQGDGGNDIVEGGDSNDTLNGGAGSDRLLGGAGRDTLAGGTDAPDRCDGGADNDRLAPSHGCEVVVDIP
jgi:hypothetical protein